MATQSNNRDLEKHFKDLLLTWETQTKRGVRRKDSVVVDFSLVLGRTIRWVCTEMITHTLRRGGEQREGGRERRGISPYCIEEI